jgi:hypothetical protein
MSQAFELYLGSCYAGVRGRIIPEPDMKGEYTLNL